MDKAQAAVGLFIGCFLIYLSIFGLSGLGFMALKAPTWKDDFEDGVKDAKWTVYRIGKSTTFPTVSEANGKLNIQSPSTSGPEWSTGGYYSTDTKDMQNGCHVEATMVRPTANYGLFGFSIISRQIIGDVAQVLDWGEYYHFEFGRTSIGLYRKAASDASQKQLWTKTFYGTQVQAALSCESGQLVLYVDGVQQYTENFALSTRKLYVKLQGHLDTPNSISSFEKYEEHLLTGDGTTPQKGTLRVFASFDGAYIACQVTVSGPETFSGTTTTDSNNPLSFAANAGTYTITGTYSGKTVTDSKTVSAGQTADSSLNFGGKDVTPPTPWDFERIIKDLFNNPLIRTLQLLVGIGLVGICGIKLVVPKGRSQPASQ